MVNEETRKLLTFLKQAEGPLSGAALARQFGVSRVALWKRFEALRHAGYRVVADRSGYTLLGSDKPLPWEFPGDEARTFHFETLESTMDEALRLGLQGLPEGAVVAEHQQKGRGRDDKSWQSPGGDLLVTLIVRPRLPVAFAGALALEAAACLADTLEELYGLSLSLKWPNDLLAGDRKVAGVLVEAWGAAESPRFYTVGLGLNVHSLPDLDRPVASVKGLGRPQADRRDILSQWRRRVGRWCADPRPEPLRWASRAAAPSRMTVQTYDGDTETGLPHGFDKSGSLLLDSGGRTLSILYGEARTIGVST